MPEPEAVDFIIDCENPAAFDAVAKHFGAAVHQGDDGEYVWRGGGYLVRCLGNARYFEFAVQKQGYGRIIKKLDALA